MPTPPTSRSSPRPLPSTTRRTAVRAGGAAGSGRVGTRLVVGAIIVDDLAAPTRVLAARRVAPPQTAGGWEFPGGKVEPGESPQAALCREIHEELDVRVELGVELVGPDQGHWPISASLRMRLWFARIVTGSPTVQGGHDALRWLTPRLLDDVSWLPADAAVLARLTAVMHGAP